MKHFSGRFALIFAFTLLPILLPGSLNAGSFYFYIQNDSILANQNGVILGGYIELNTNVGSTTPGIEGRVFNRDVVSYDVTATKGGLTDIFSSTNGSYLQINATVSPTNLVVSPNDTNQGVTFTDSAGNSLFWSTWGAFGNYTTQWFSPNTPEFTSFGYTNDNPNLQPNLVATSGPPPSAVPEPSSLALFVLGGIGLVLAEYRRRRATCLRSKT